MSHPDELVEGTIQIGAGVVKIIDGDATLVLEVRKDVMTKGVNVILIQQQDVVAPAPAPTHGLPLLERNQNQNLNLTLIILVNIFFASVCVCPFRIVFDVFFFFLSVRLACCCH